MGFTEEDRASLLTLARGAAIERFDDELQRVLNNIVDPNTGGGVREVTLKVKIKPDANRTTGAVEILCTSKVQAAQPCSTMFYIGRQGTMGVAFEHDPQQMSMPYPEPSVIAGGKAGNE
jgi:hypothetical protein